MSAFRFSSSQSAFYKVLISNAATSALRLHQRLPRIQLTKEFLALLLVEDSAHYLFFSLIFLYVQPFILILFPVVLFAVLHSASYSLKILDVSYDFELVMMKSVTDCKQPLEWRGIWPGPKFHYRIVGQNNEKKKQKIFR